MKKFKKKLKDNKLQQNLIDEFRNIKKNNDKNKKDDKKKKKEKKIIK